MVDTSTFNLMVERGVTDEQLATIRATRYVRLSGLSIEEMFATPDASHRAALWNYAARLIEHENSDTLMPAHEIIKTLILAHYDNPWSFHWEAHDVRAEEYRNEIRRGKIVHDSELSAEQREQDKHLKRQFRTNFTSLRLAYDQVFNERGVARPRAYSESVQDMQSRPQRFDISVAKTFYDRIAGCNRSRFSVAEFVSACDPMRAYLHAHQMGRYDLALRDQHHGERFQAGRNDLHMAVYLPYVEEFVTDEKNGEHGRCLREIVVSAGLSTNILTFDEFYEGLRRGTA